MEDIYIIVKVRDDDIKGEPFSIGFNPRELVRNAYLRLNSDLDYTSENLTEINYLPTYSEEIIHKDKENFFYSAFGSDSVRLISYSLPYELGKNISDNLWERKINYFSDNNMLGDVCVAIKKWREDEKKRLEKILISGAGDSESILRERDGLYCAFPEINLLLDRYPYIFGIDN